MSIVWRLDAEIPAWFMQKGGEGDVTESFRACAPTARVGLTLEGGESVSTKNVPRTKKVGVFYFNPIKARPFPVRRYFCLLLFGLSGIVSEIRSCRIAGFRYADLKCLSSFKSRIT